MAIDVLRCISGLCVRSKGLRSQVKGNIEKVNTFLICFDCKLQVVFAECATYFLLDTLDFSWWEVEGS